MLFLIYIIALAALSTLSWGFVNVRSPFPQIAGLLTFVADFRAGATVLYLLVFVVLFFVYVLILRKVQKKGIKLHAIKRYIAVGIVVLFLGFPGFSYDVFNYMATAKVAYIWHENPYIVMPIEIPNEPMLTYMQAANKVALYGPAWIAITALPQYVGFGNPLLTLYMFKLMNAGFYLATAWMLWRLSNKNVWPVAFFCLNPIVLSEILLSGHNDIVMMFSALASYYLMQKNKIVLSAIVFICSVLIKYATILLFPVYLYMCWKTIKKEKITWDSVWLWSAIFMYVAFLLSPLREEIYAWYFVWPLTFLALIDNRSILTWISYGFTFGLPFRLAPYIYSVSWIGYTPLVKKLVTFIPPAVSGVIYGSHLQEKS